MIQRANDSPEESETGRGREFTGYTVQFALRDFAIEHRVEDPQDKNANATVDLAISGLKKV